VYDIVRFAVARILCQGRGSAANSAVCLGITAVDPARGTLLMGRFISRAQ
jgi:error-prone DNA polymerase